MRRDHRPYFIKKAYLRLQALYARHFLAPQFDQLGPGYTILAPWNVKVFGGPVRVGKYANMITTPENKIRLTVWAEKEGHGRIVIGDYGLICPGVRISSAEEIIIGHNCMIAGGAYITDSDWHGIYDRVLSMGVPEPVHIGDNVWIGDHATICKGVTIGENSIIGTGSVVLHPVPPNTVAAGNPARVVKQLDPDMPMRRRSDWFADPVRLEKDIDAIDRNNLRHNTFLRWLQTLFFPDIND